MCAVRLAYLSVTNTLALLRLLPMSDRYKDAEILALWHQIMVLERHLHGERVRFTRADRAWLSALIHPVPRDVLHHLRLLVRPETVLRWHRDLIARQHARRSRPTRPDGHEPSGRSADSSYAWPTRTPPGDTEESTVNCSCSVSRSPHPPSGRFFTRRVSIRRPNARAARGPRSFVPRRRPSSPPTSSKRPR